MSSPTSIEKGLRIDARTGALYGAAGGFAIGLAWQTVAAYDNPLPLWRNLILTGAALGGITGFTLSRRQVHRRGVEDAEKMKQQ